MDISSLQTLDASDSVIAQTSAKWGMGGGAATSIFGTISNDTLLVIIGVVTTILGFAVNFYYQRRRDKRAEALYKLQRELLKAQINGQTDTD
jgi:hypothetical protein